MENHIFIGIGGTGVAILDCLKRKIKEERMENRLPWGFIYVDTDNITHYNRSEALPSEFVHIDTSLAKHAIEEGLIDHYPHIKPWFGDINRWKQLLENYSGTGTKQCRRLGRLLFALHKKEFLICLQRQVQVQNHFDMNVNFHIFSSACGGLGSGALIDTILYIRELFPSDFNIDYPKNPIDLFIKVPEKDVYQKDIGRYEANAFVTIHGLKKYHRHFSACNIFTNNTYMESYTDSELYNKVAEVAFIFNRKKSHLDFFTQNWSHGCHGFKAFGISTISLPKESNCLCLKDLIKKMHDESKFLLNIYNPGYPLENPYTNRFHFLITPTAGSEQMIDQIISECNRFYMYNGKLYCLDINGIYNTPKISIIKMGFALRYEFEGDLKSRYLSLVNAEENGALNRFMLHIEDDEDYTKKEYY